jgi:transcriptional regulator with XRE-family HTH domain
MSLGERIKQRREEKVLRPIELARLAEVSKGYLSEIESGGAPRPSGAVLFRIATVLGTTVADLLDKEIRPAANSVSQALKDFAEEADLPEEDVRMLTQVRFRGDQPSSKEDWRYLYESIKRSIVRGS